MSLTKQVNGEKVGLYPSEEIEVLAAWMENERPSTPVELNNALEAEVQRELNLSPKMKVIFKQLFLLRQANEPLLTETVFLAELKKDYKSFKS